MGAAFDASGVAARRRADLGKLGLILVCMVTARTVAMASNRLLDAELDRKNPAHGSPGDSERAVVCAGLC